MIDLSPLDRHTRIALSFSGGKDSLACVYLLQNFLDRITIYHCDAGDLLPEMREVVDHVASFAPHFVRIETDALGWIDQHGLPTDLLPHSAHPLGQVMAEHRVKLVARYDCCFHNLMWPTYSRIRDDGNTLLIRGTKRVDMNRLPAAGGEVLDGVELYYPLQEWSHQQVFDFLRAVGAPIPRVYDYVTNSPECARCSAWWGEQRAAYLRRYHPGLWQEYSRRLLSVVHELATPIAQLKREAEGALDAPELPDGVLDAATDLALAKGVRVLQGNRLATDDAGHVTALLQMMNPPRDATILDAGCGIGEVALLMRAERPDLKFVLLNRNKAQLALTPDGEGFAHMLGDIHRMLLPDGAVDGVMFLYSLCHTDPFVALGEARRVTRPHGFCFVYDYERLDGDNRLMEQRLGARAYPRAVFLEACQASGWRPVMGAATGGDDSLFRYLFDDDEGYDAIFRSLQPVVWRLETV